MASFEDVLAQHRTALANYFAEWSQQQESILARYVHGDGCELTSVGVRAQARRGCQFKTLEPRDASDECPRKTGNAISIQQDVFGGMARRKAGLQPRLPNELVGRDMPTLDVEEEPTLDIKAYRSPQTAITAPPVSCETRRIQESILGIFSIEGTEAAKSRAKSARRGLFVDVVESVSFTYVFAIIIMANVATMAIAANLHLHAAKDGTQPNLNFFDSAEYFFIACYVIGIGFRTAAFGRDFFVGCDWQVNLFDVAVIVFALVDQITSLFMNSRVNFTYLRIYRIVKLVKVVRVVKIFRSFKELRVIAASIMGCTASMLWAIALLVIVLFVFALLFVQEVTRHFSMTPVEEWNADFLKYWGSIERAMLSLFKAATGGNDWADLAKPLWELGWGYYGAFMVYICFFMFVVVNVLTGLFVDAALAASNKDDAMMIREQMNNEEKYVQLIRSLFHRLDADASGDLEFQEFEKGMNKAEMHAFASALNIEISDIHDFFRLLSAGGRDVVDIERFVVGCMKLQGSAKSVDLVSLLHRTITLEQQMTKFIGRTDQQLQDLPLVVCRALQEQGA